jgi:hypothetical protein
LHKNFKGYLKIKEKVQNISKSSLLYLNQDLFNTAIFQEDLNWYYGLFTGIAIGDLIAARKGPIAPNLYFIYLKTE